MIIKCTVPRHVTVVRNGVEIIVLNGSNLADSKNFRMGGDSYLSQVQLFM